jgi:peptidyl-prolyl cis-trans isomerase B (cyclophilin B)
MAKTAYPDSAGSQFFLVYADSALPPEYAVLGKVDESGMAALDAIADAGARSDDPSSPDNQVPRDTVTISKAVVG